MKQDKKNIYKTLLKSHHFPLSKLINQDIRKGIKLIKSEIIEKNIKVRVKNNEQTNIY